MRASVKVMLHPLRKNKDGTKSIVIRLTIDRDRTYISLGYKTLEKYWNQETGRLFRTFDPVIYKGINEDLGEKYLKALTILREFDRKGKPLTFQGFISKFKNEKKAESVFSFFDFVIEELVSRDRVGNAASYRQSRNALKRFIGEKEVKFSDIDVAFLNRWETMLCKSCSGNSISNYMRTFRALYNRAIDESHCEREYYPFKSPFNRNGYNIKRLETKTAKRALNQLEMEKLIACQPPVHSSLSDSKRMFLFSYYLMGMNFIDMAYLKWSNVQNGRLTYQRIKTKKQYSIKLLPPAQGVLDYYAAFSDKKGYVFPILSAMHKTEQQKKTRIKTALKKTNDEIKQIGKEAGIENWQSLTTYVARHSWGTILKRKGISTSLISDGYGHESEETTQIYLDEFENSVLDEMNQRLLG